MENIKYRVGKEVSLRTSRTNGQQVHMSVLKYDDQPELVIGIAKPEQIIKDEWPEWVTLSREEVGVLREFLNNPEVIKLLGE